MHGNLTAIIILVMLLVLAIMHLAPMLFILKNIVMSHNGKTDNTPLNFVFLQNTSPVHLCGTFV